MNLLESITKAAGIYPLLILAFVILVTVIIGEKIYISWKKKKYNPHQKALKKNSFLKKGKHKYYDEAIFGGGKYMEMIHDNDSLERISQERIEEILKNLDLKTREARHKQIQNMIERGEVHETEKEAMLVIIKRISEHVVRSEMLMREYAEGEKPFLSSAIHESLIFFEKGDLEGCYKRILEGIAKSKEKGICTPAEESDLLKQMGEKYMSFSMFVKGEECFTKARDIWEEDQGEANERYVYFENRIAQTLLFQKDAERAFEHCYKALSVAIQVFGKSSYQAANCFTGVGNCLFAKEELEKAHDYWIKALNLSLENYGENHPATATCYTNLGRIYIREKDLLDKGVFYITEGIRQDSKFFGYNHERIFVQYNILAIALFEHQEVEKSIKYFKKTYAVAKKVYGDLHSFLVSTLNNIGGVLFFAKKYDEAIKYYHKSLHINGRIVGEKHQEIAIIHDNLGRAWRAKNEYEKAMFHYQKALEIFNVLSISEQGGILTVKKNLCEIAEKMGDEEMRKKYACEIAAA